MNIRSIRQWPLAAAIGAIVGAAGIAAVPAIAAAVNNGSSRASVSAITTNLNQTTGSQSYIITFTEAGLVNYAGDVNGLQATTPQTDSAQRKLDVRSPAARAYEAYLAAQRTQHLSAIQSALGRGVTATHTYAVTVNGIAAELNAAEAATVANVPGVKSVKPAGVQHLLTYRSAKFIGADKIWDGSATPTGAAGATKGKGILVGDLDGGTNSGSPSFANDPACGFRASAPKLVAVDCSATDVNGFCDGPNPEANPTFGHGVHTSSTIAGDTIDNTANPAPVLPNGVTMSGIAPCAAIHHYKVCQTNSCAGADIFAGIQNAIADQVDVLNFSISGGTDPWNDNDRDFLDAVNGDVFVAAAAGNLQAGETDPHGLVNHLGPWVMTVAASTQDQIIGPQLAVTGPGTVPPPPPDLGHILLNPGNTTSTGTTVDLLSQSLISYPPNIIGCTAGGAFPGNYFSGRIALIRRGTCPFTEKITNAYNAGAIMVVIANNQPGTINMNTTGAPAIPAFSVLQSDGDALIAFAAGNNPPAPPLDTIFADGFDLPVGGTIADYHRAVMSATQGDVLADFSYRGPVPAPTADSTKPDIAAPGVNIYAATDPASGNYQFMSGTSMATPQVTGAGALVRAVHPDWTVTEVKSALMMTATNAAGVEQDGTTPWVIDDVGSGRVDLTKAALAGLTMNETYANFLAADPAATVPGDVKTLNLPLLRNMTCAPNCSWTRTVKNRLATSGTWGVTFATDPAFGVTATPATFTLAPGATQTITFKATPTTLLTAAAFGNAILTESTAQSPAQHISIAVKSTSAPPPTVTCTAGNCTFQVDQLASAFSGLGCATYCGFTWLNRFTPNAADYPITITKVSTIFGSPAGWNATGDQISVYIYQDADNDPSNGATPVGTPTVYTMGAPVNAFVDITLTTPVVLNGPGDVIIALSNPNATNVGARPATMDAGPFVGRSWIGDPAASATTAPDLSTLALALNSDAGFSKNYLIRASGTGGHGQPIVIGIDPTTQGKK
ncbi:MAG: S8 family serine peptidase [Dokdonella sp.]